MHETEDFNFHIEDNGRIVGGIVAGSLRDTLEVDFLFLNTYRFQAPEFYKKLGYTEILKLSPAFNDFTQSYFIKNL